jgi:nucleoside-diphosphate-sugar epimerase
MRILVTGSSGHLGEALMRKLGEAGHDAVGLDLLPSPFTHHVGSIVDGAFVRACTANVDAVIHAATLHKPHVATHARQDFIDVNITGTLNLLEAAAAAHVQAFVYTSTTSVFSGGLPPSGAPAAWITEDAIPLPKNIYGITKHTAEDLCRLIHRRTGLPCIVLRTSRFFPEADDDEAMRAAYADDNSKANEYVYRRVDIEDAAEAHLLALERARSIGFARYIISATTPFRPEDTGELAHDAPSVAARRVPAYETIYATRGWRMFPNIDRVYDNTRARNELGWRPRYDFVHVLDRLSRNEDFRSRLAHAVGSKGYHAETFSEGPYPVEP